MWSPVLAVVSALNRIMANLQLGKTTLRSGLPLALAIQLTVVRLTALIQSKCVGRQRHLLQVKSSTPCASTISRDPRSLSACGRSTSCSATSGRRGVGSLQDSLPLKKQLNESLQSTSATRSSYSFLRNQFQRAVNSKWQ